MNRRRENTQNVPLKKSRIFLNWISLEEEEEEEDI